MENLGLHPAWDSESSKRFTAWEVPPSEKMDTGGTLPSKLSLWSNVSVSSNFGNGQKVSWCFLDAKAQALWSLGVKRSGSDVIGLSMDLAMALSIP